MASKFVQSRSIFSTINRSIFTTTTTTTTTTQTLSRSSYISPFLMIGGFCEMSTHSYRDGFTPDCPTLQRLNSPRREIISPGMDMEHYFVYFPVQSVTADRHEIIDYYIKLLSQVVGSEDEARKRIYSVSTKLYLGFGALLPEQEFRDKLKAIPEVSHVLPDMYEDEENKRYPGEPFINGQVVPYDPKYHKVYADMIDRRNRKEYVPRLMKRGWDCKSLMIRAAGYAGNKDI